MRPSSFEIVRDRRAVAADEVIDRIMARYAARKAVRDQDGEEREHQREKADLCGIESPAHGQRSPERVVEARVPATSTARTGATALFMPPPARQETGSQSLTVRSRARRPAQAT